MPVADTAEWNVIRQNYGRCWYANKMVPVMTAASRKLDGPTTAPPALSMSQVGAVPGAVLGDIVGGPGALLGDLVGGWVTAAGEVGTLTLAPTQ